MDGIDLDLVRELAEFRAQRGRALSLYLDLDPSTTPTAAELDSRIGSLLSEARAQAGDAGSHDARVGLGEDLTRIEEFFGQEFERNGARGLALFSDGPDGLWRIVELPEPVEDALSVGEELHVAPLAPLTGRPEALVAVVGREQGLVLALRGSALVPVSEQFDEVEGRHSQGGWSQARFQRHIENLVQEHLREVAARVERELRRGGAFRPLVLVATEATAASFAELLSVEARAAVAGTVQAEAHASPAELLALVQPVLDATEAARERDVLGRWREAVVREEGRGVAGWAETLAAASDGKVACLVFAEGVTHPARRCPECGRVEADVETCALDGAATEPIPHGLDAAIRQVLAFGGDLITVRHHQDLDPVGGIGALLRF
jgi:peptide subunit release factor 1 (eRF1)